TGEKPRRSYDPAPLLAVDRVAVGPERVLGESADGTWLVDVHHRAHPCTKNADGVHGVSLGFTSHYALMHERFGERITVGSAGEWGPESFRWAIGWWCFRRDARCEMRDAWVPMPYASRISFPASRHFVPRQRCLLLAPLAGQIPHIGAEPLAVAAGGAHSVGK